MKRGTKAFCWSFVIAMLLVTYMPLIILMIFSFAPDSKSMGNFADISWSPQLYVDLFNDAEILEAIKNSLLIALTSSLLATVIGTLAAVGIHQLGRRWKRIVNGMGQITVINADIVTGAAFMLFFTYLPSEIQGYPALIIAHTIITMPYVLLSVTPRLVQLNPNLYEAGLDLGAGPMRTLVEIIMPQLVPGMISGFGLAFTLSLDDYVISKFINGNVDTISTLIYSATKHAKGMEVWRAVSTLFFVAILVVLVIYNVVSARKKKEA